MPRIGVLLAVLALLGSGFAQNAAEGQFKLALPDHNGQLRWSAPGFTIIEMSAKSNGFEIGVRGKDQTGKITFLAFLFEFTEKAPLTSAKCRDGVLDPEKKANPAVTVVSSSEREVPGGLPIAIVTYTSKDRSSKTIYMARGFVASGEICGDLEFYSDSPISADDPSLKNVFDSYHLDENYTPQYRDVMLVAQILYEHHAYAAAGPRFELALAKLRQHPEGDVTTMTRVVLTDQAGMAYGISGDIKKSRAIFEKALAEDPDYPLYYYNLACDDAEEKNLGAAREHLQRAFDRKAHVLQGEAMPDPTKDDSFTPYRNNKEFWAFVESLHP